MNTPEVDGQMNASPFDQEHKYFVHLTRPAVDVKYPNGKRVTHIRPGSGKSRIMDTLLSAFIKSSNGAA